MSIIELFKIRNNELCPCGSGEKFSSCCKGKTSPPQKATRKPPNVQAMELFRSSLKKICLHPDNDQCKGNIGDAHAIQSHKILSLLAGDEGHVYCLNPKKTPIIEQISKKYIDTYIPMDRVSINKATTETCFCKHHDDLIFKAIEKSQFDFDETNELAKFIYAYRAFIFEFYKVFVSIEMFRSLFQMNSKIFSSFMMVRLYRSFQRKMREFENIKSVFDHEILTEKHNGIYTCVLRFPEQIKFADYAYIAPRYDLCGRKIKRNADGIMNYLSITVIPEMNQSYILLSCLNSQEHIYRNLFKQISTAPPVVTRYYFNNLLPLYSENIVLSPSLWKTWGDDEKKAFESCINLKNAQAIESEMRFGAQLRAVLLKENPEIIYRSMDFDLFL